MALGEAHRSRNARGARISSNAGTSRRRERDRERGVIEKRRRAEERRAREERRIVEAPTETEQRGGDERRMLADRRRRTLLAAKVIYNDRQSVIDCTVRNLSRSGARLFFETVSEVPDRFELDFGQSGPRWCEVAYRAANQFGVHFIDLDTDAAEAGVASVSSSAVGARPAPTVDNPRASSSSSSRHRTRNFSSKPSRRSVLPRSHTIARRRSIFGVRAGSTSSSTRHHGRSPPISPTSTDLRPVAWPSGSVIRTSPPPGRSSSARNRSTFRPGPWS